MNKFLLGLVLIAGAAFAQSLTLNVNFDYSDSNGIDRVRRQSTLNRPIADTTRAAQVLTANTTNQVMSFGAVTSPGHALITSMATSGVVFFGFNTTDYGFQVQTQGINVIEFTGSNLNYKANTNGTKFSIEILSK